MFRIWSACLPQISCSTEFKFLRNLRTSERRLYEYSKIKKQPWKSSIGSNCRWRLFKIIGSRYNINSCPKSARPGAMTTKLVASAASTISPACPKCATNKASKRSCCARGGAWFKNCGDSGNTKFDHTWAEGIQACKSRFWRSCFSL